jgi:hypothetical protein
MLPLPPGLCIVTLFEFGKVPVLSAFGKIRCSRESVRVNILRVVLLRRVLLKLEQVSVVVSSLKQETRKK